MNVIRGPFIGRYSITGGPDEGAIIDAFKYVGADDVKIPGIDNFELTIADPSIKTLNPKPVLDNVCIYSIGLYDTLNPKDGRRAINGVCWTHLSVGDDAFQGMKGRLYVFDAVYNPEKGNGDINFYVWDTQTQY